MSSPIKRNGPGATPGAVSPSLNQGREDEYQDTVPARIPHLTAAEIAESRPAYVVVVKTQSDRRVRRLFLSLASAEKAALRAQARGSAVSLELMRLVPYTVGAELHGDEDGGAR